jgi:PadR family transcriptional regulator PadR
MHKNLKVPELRYTEAVILGVLLSNSAGHMFGLEILEDAGGMLKKGSLYVTLQRMEEKKLLESRQEERQRPEVGIPRRLYNVTGLGERAFNKYRVSHQRLTELMGTA